jgi:DNA-directed RNA polymerase specialized sigma subunit
MTKEELFKYKSITAEIEQIKQSLSNVEPEYSKDTVTGSDIEFPYTKHNFNIEGYDYGNYERKIQRIQNRLNRKLVELVEEKDKLTKYIYSLKDSEVRQIFTYRYINGLSWREIGEKMNYSFETVRKKHDKFIRYTN